MLGDSFALIQKLIQPMISNVMLPYLLLYKNQVNKKTKQKKTTYFHNLFILI